MYCIDRLSRAKLRHALTLIDEILEAGVRLHAVDIGEVRDTDNINIIILSWQAGEERKKIVDRMMRGKYGKAQSGRWVGSGPVPFGFQRIGRLNEARLEHKADELAIIKLLIDKYLGLSGPPLSMNGLRDELYSRGLPSPNGHAVWQVSTIARVLGSPALIGRFDYGAHVVTLADLAILDRATWDAVQARVKSNRERAARNRKHDYLLSSSRLRCICGRVMTAVSLTRHGRIYRYYTCGQVQDHPAVRTCLIHRVSVTKVETAVWNWTLEHIDDDRLADGLNRLSDYERVQADDPRRLSDIDAESKHLRARLVALMAEFGESEKRHVIEARNAAIDKAADRLEALDAERAGLAATSERADARSASRASLSQRVKGLRAKLDAATTAQQVQVLDVIELRVRLLEKSEKPACIKIRIESEIAPPEELTIS